MNYITLLGFRNDSYLFRNLWCFLLHLQEEAERSALEKIQQVLTDGKPARSVSLTDVEKDSVKHLCLLTLKPVIYVANVAESDVADPDNNPYVQEVTKVASDLNSGVVTISAQVFYTV